MGRLEIIIAERLFGTNCVHASLAAVLGESVIGVRRWMPDFEKMRCDTIALKKSVLDRAGRKWRDIGVACPRQGTYGLVCLCFGDEDSTRDHAIAVRNDGRRIMVFDNHSSRWTEIGSWERSFLPTLKRINSSDRCWIHSVIEVEPKERT